MCGALYNNNNNDDDKNNNNNNNDDNNNNNIIGTYTPDLFIMNQRRRSLCCCTHHIIYYICIYSHYCVCTSARELVCMYVCAQYDSRRPSQRRRWWWRRQPSQGVSRNPYFLRLFVGWWWTKPTRAPHRIGDLDNTAPSRSRCSSHAPCKVRGDDATAHNILYNSVRYYTAGCCTCEIK